MDDQKIENLLNLALDATAQEREKSESLEVGFDQETQKWEVIVRYSGDLQAAVPDTWRIVILSGGYAIVTLPQEDVNTLAELPQVQYIEKPKKMYFAADAGRRASCISALQTSEFNLFGRGILVAVIDSGVDYFHPDFRNDDGSTRILSMWDQTGAGRIPDGFASGAEYLKEEIDRALAEYDRTGNRMAGLAIVPEQDLSGHGTQVLGIAAGNGRSSGGRYRGVAPESEIIAVKLGQPREEGFPRTTELMQAIEYVYRKAEEFGLPMAVNISFGTVYGSHRGNSLLETYLDTMAARGQTVIVVGTGNEGDSGGHVSGMLDVTEEVQLLISEFETSASVQIWKNYVDEFRISVVAPDGRVIGPVGQEIGAARYRAGDTELLIYYGEPSPYQGQQEIYLDFIARNTYIDSGVWRIALIPQRIVTGEYQLWLNDSRARNSQTRFVRSTPEVTMTIPSAASSVIAVGAYDARQNIYAPFSGRGWPDAEFDVRPDLAAPGVDITTTAAGGGYVSVTGTSFATPFVTGSAALLMQWGIVRGNDPYLYGEKVRAYLRKGARQLPGYEIWPNNQLGYGALCLKNSFPEA